MGHLTLRSAVSPVRRGRTTDLGRRPSVTEATSIFRPAEPMHCLRPAALADSAAVFVNGFAGDVLYAVKCNPEPTVLRALWAGGIRHFDVASPGEIRLTAQVLPDAHLHYMHPVKDRGAIAVAYGHYGVRDFALDSLDEADKLHAETRGADDMGLIVRLALPKGQAQHDLSGKFGAAPAEAAALLRLLRPRAHRLGLSFHVGSQCLDPAAYVEAIGLAGGVIADAGVALEVLDVGGGFPVVYPGLAPPPANDYFAAITSAVDALGLPAGCRLWCEPGRALVAGGVSLVLKVLLRRGDSLYVNDGVYGSLHDCRWPGVRFPARLVRPGRPSIAPVRPFQVFGPTCDSVDRLVEPFILPDDVREGDWIELGQMGAYGASLRTGFNGFDQARLVEVTDPPLVETPGFAVGGSARAAAVA